jgi:RNA polymerase sigma-70 factor (ECF subfamily)
MNAPGDERRSPAPAGEFATTEWSVVLRAGKRDDPAGHAALAALCERYWYPLYAYVRRRVTDVNDAQDLTQAFFVRLLEKNALAAALPQRGRFRGFLLVALKNFLANEADRAHAQKRGGGAPRLSLDFAAGESKLGLEPAHTLSPERLFERQWALTLLGGVVARLEAEYAASGKARQFDALKAVLNADRELLPYAALAAELDMSEAAVRQAASRLRRRYRELLRDEVAQTVASPEEVEDEIRSLFQIFSP